MKKLITMLIFTGVFSSVFAVDLSIDTSKTNQSNKEQSISAKDSKDVKKSESKKDSTSYSKDKSKSKSKEVTKLESANVKRYIKTLERKNIYPFNKCKVLTKPKFAKDFGISYKDEELGIIDTGLKSSYEASAQSNQYVHEEVLDFDETNQLKFFDYVNCMNYYAGIQAQAFKTGELKGEITDKEILKTFNNVQEFLAEAVSYEDAKPRWNGAIDNFTFGALSLKLAYEPELFFNQVALYSKDSFHGYSANSKKTITLTKSKKKDRTRSYDDSINLSRSTDSTLTDKISGNQDYSFKTNFSIRNYIPKL